MARKRETSSGEEADQSPEGPSGADSAELADAEDGPDRPRRTVVDLDAIKDVLALMESHQLTEFELEQPEFRIRLCKGGRANAVAGAPPLTPHPPAHEPHPAAPAAAAATETEGATPVTSPMVGTMYRAPSPDAKSFVEVGDHVTEDTVVCLIEAMKVMNEIKAEVEGEVVTFLVENGEPVEFGQPILLVRLAAKPAANRT
jgi:acetyl-CoA carboxylase biotin carboxyl carrier protein